MYLFKGRFLQRIDGPKTLNGSIMFILACFGHSIYNKHCLVAPKIIR